MCRIVVPMWGVSVGKRREGKRLAKLSNIKKHTHTQPLNKVEQKMDFPCTTQNGMTVRWRLADVIRNARKFPFLLTVFLRVDGAVLLLNSREATRKREKEIEKVRKTHLNCGWSTQRDEAQLLHVDRTIGLISSCALLIHLSFWERMAVWLMDLGCHAENAFARVRLG